MLEFDTRLEAKRNSEFLTPEKLRIIVADNVKGSNLKVLEPAIGSGQLLFNFIEKVSKVKGYDINIRPLEICKENLKDKVEVNHTDFICEDIEEHFDLTVCNYPFSLRPTEEQKDYIKNNYFLNSFYKKDITGVLDFVFIMKSFNVSKEGIYLCFPGIGYRQQEKEFRKYLIDNDFIKEMGIIENCKFEHTSISILYLHLTKTKNEKTTSFRLNLQTGERIETTASFPDFTFDVPQFKVEEKIVNPIDLETLARKRIVDILKKEIDFSKKIYKVDKNIRDNFVSVNVMIDDIIKELNNLKD